MRNPSLRDAIAPLIIGIGVAVSVIACGPAGSGTLGPSINASQSAQAKSDAKALARCLPKSSLKQIELAKSLTTHSGRKALEDTCGIPSRNKAAFESSVLSAAEQGHLSTRGGRAAFFTVTLPKIVEANQG